MDQIDEYEQGERVRTWLKNNGSSLVVGVALGLAALGGWQWWQGQQAQRKADAAGEFMAFSKALEAGEADKAAAFATAITQSYPKTLYPALVALRQAAELAGKGQGDEAIAALDRVPREGLDPALAELLDLRAARILVALDRHDDALARLGSGDASRYPAAHAEIRGDAEAGLGRRDAARAAYERALDYLDQAAPTRALVELKYNDAGGAAAASPEA